MPAYTFVSAGSNSTTGNPGQPAGKAAGNLLLMYAAARGASETFNGAPSGWQALSSQNSLAIMGRIATNDAADDVVAYDFWSGVTQDRCAIACFSGDIYTDLTTIVLDTGVSSGSNLNIPSPACTVVVDNCLIFSVCKKNKTAASGTVTVIDPVQLGTRIDIVAPSTGNVMIHVWNYDQQTTATNIAAGAWDQDNEENSAYASVVMALKSQAAAAATIQRIQHTENQLMVL